MTCRLALSLGLLALAIAAPALANTRSQQLYAKALIPFHAQRWQDAQRLLNDAVLADPDDAVALYYRGLTYARLGQGAEAIRDIEHALALKPDLEPAVLDLGILYAETGQYASAQQWLERAHQQPANRFTAAFYLGLVSLRTGQNAAAVQSFTEAAKDPGLRQAAQYYQAVAQWRDGERGEAQALFTQVEGGGADLETAQVAKQFLANPPSAVAGEPTGFEAHANAGFGYDSNVALIPSSSAAQAGLDTDGEMDGMFRVGAGAGYTWTDDNLGSANLGYNLYQSVHFTTSTYDLTSNRINLTLATPRGRFWQAGIVGLYDVYFLNYQTFYQAGRGTPFLNFYEGDIAATQVFYSFGGQDFFRGPFDPFRDSYINAAGARQYFLLGAANRYLSLGYRWDDYDPLSRDGTDFAYTDNMFDVAVDFDVYEGGHAQMGYLFDLQEYEHPNSRTDYSKRRHDGQNQVVLNFTHQFTDLISADIAYLGVFNGSNIPDFEYNRNIIQANVWLQF
ncbi:MAG: tetratricopeptide repeat protein [Deltaproteobacteria bacterium]|nr:tetratricopeptide repeat protein [Deltaproteobacteria bacterium]